MVSNKGMHSGRGDKSLGIILVAHKGDYYFTKICVASIRYFYPDVKIFLVKDIKKGDFSTFFLEKYFDIKLIDLEQKYFGWCNAKLFIYASKQISRGRYLVLDSDIVFAGKVLDLLEQKSRIYDYLVSPEYHNLPAMSNFKKIYYDIKWVKKTFRGFTYPGFTFNCGQLVFKTGKLSFTDYGPYFSPRKLPYWNRKYIKEFQSRDQSFLNILLPYLAKKKLLKLGKVRFMKWSESTYVRKNVKLDQIIQGKYKFLIHWAGLLRSNNNYNATRTDILDFFKGYYYSKLPFGSFINLARRLIKRINYIHYREI